VTYALVKPTHAGNRLPGGCANHSLAHGGALYAMASDHAHEPGTQDQYAAPGPDATPDPRSGHIVLLGSDASTVSHRVPLVIQVPRFPGSLRATMPSRAWPEIPCLFVSVAGQFVGGGSSGVCGPAEEAGEQLEFGVAVFGADLVH
jgi:hypothetical protein